MTRYLRSPAVGSVVLLACGLVLSCAPPAEPEPQLEADTETATVDDTAGMWDVVGATWRWHIESAKRKNLDAVLEIYADDIVYVVPGHVDVRGIEAVREMEANTLANNEVVDAKHTSLSLQLFDDVAYEIGTVVGPIRVGDAPPTVVRYHFTAMWQRGPDDGWRIRHIVGQAPPE